MYTIKLFASASAWNAGVYFASFNTTDRTKAELHLSAWIWQRIIIDYSAPGVDTIAVYNLER